MSHLEQNNLIRRKNARCICTPWLSSQKPEIFPMLIFMPFVCLFVCFVFNWEDKFAKEHFKPFILLAPIGVRLLKQTLLPDSSGDAAIKFKSLSFVCFFFLNQWRLGTSPTLILLKARGWQKKLHFDWESVHASIRPRIWDQHRRCRTERF